MKPNELDLFGLFDMLETALQQDANVSEAIRIINEADGKTNQGD